ncbi:ABC transporter permease [Serratia marcescens]|uniref:ABC transporter permease n=1 Tax=Serratia marcescens TaxID=615 RepID=UPI0007452CEA|nr:ABC transporter permease [Serratia marcescens]CUZ82608.1 Macrolide export ATP-binding/permease protein MacB [Serratia marcescens]CVA16060.1 Macrolide export ATP-binding/permease protein MacB [Serratia marcescens]CVC14378.1 Macrolide export ATP-binding/permease protein MacB [Serratia marcescens]CVC82095.1 Macrolide export ATP-binding/permease protein MacB [Serratia marcescens]CVE26590.1 Macrolide export ATP-binding/permease protein MacB [Serratia marcescens]
MSVNTAPIIALDNVSREFQAGEQKIAVLKRISLSIQRGEMVAIVGASGSGKSTLMNIIGCLDKPSQGDVHINGVAIGQADADRLAQLRSRHIGFIFQRYHLMPYLTAGENVAIPALYTAMSAAERRLRAAHLLARLGLAQRGGHRPAQLSGGQQQRVSIARALMNGAEIILADEPTGALDSASGQALMTILHELNAIGHTVVIVTHDRRIAEQARRIIEIGDGEIVADRRHEASRHLSTFERPLAAPLKRMAPGAALKEAVGMAWRALLGHRVRALLSMLGIIIGIAAVVSAIAIGEGTRRNILKEISQLGTSTLEIRPGLGWEKPRPDLARSLSERDAALLAALPYVDSVSPVIGTQLLAVREGKQVPLAVMGVGEGYFRTQGIRLLSGGLFTAQDLSERAPVAVIDPLLKQALFASRQDPSGAVVLIAGVPYRVIGVAQRRGAQYAGSQPLAWLPYTSLTGRIAGDMPLESIVMRVNEKLTLEEAGRDATRRLIVEHGRRDFFTLTDDQLTQSIQRASGSMQLLITAIAAISLLVGGVGVMNIMLVSVTERTHEIGIRLAVGAAEKDIMRQFLIEAVVICSLGGMLGIACAALVKGVLSGLAPQVTMIFTWPPLLLACGFSALIGVGFGFLPARTAARLQPVEALARE